MIRQFLTHISLALILTTTLSDGLSQKLRDRHFTHIGMDEGLSSAFCYAVCEDFRGYIWVGTASGLYKHDGALVRPYSNQSDTSGLLATYPVKSIFEDSRHYLWVGTQGAGVVVLDPGRKIFRRFSAADSTSPLSHNEVLCFGEDHLGNVWIGTEQGANIYNPASETLTQIHPAQQNVSAILSFLQDSAHRIWLGTWGQGIYRTTEGIRDGQIEFSFEQLTKTPSPHSLPENNIWQLQEDDLGRVWIACYRGGIAVIPLASEDLVIRVPADPTLKHGISSSEAFSIEFDQDHRAWVGTGNGLSISSPIPQTTHPDSLRESLKSPWEHLYKSFAAEFGPNSNDVRSVMLDQKGAIWLASENGLSRYHPSNNLFSNHSFHEDLFRTQTFTAILERPDQHLWLGIGNHLFLYDPFSRVLQRIQFPSNGVIKAFYEDPDGRLLIGTSNGLYKRETSGSIELYHQSEQIDFTSIQLGPEGTLWAAARKGLYQVSSPSQHEKTLQPVAMLDQYVIHDFVWENQYTCWLASENDGLIKYLPRENRKVHYSPFPDDPRSFNNQNFFSICLDDQDIWLGTTQGLLRFHQPNEEFTYKATESGLLGPVIHSVRKDQRGRIWVVSSPGIALWSEAMQSFQYLDLEKGLHNDEFMHNTLVDSKSGKWILAGNKSVSFFDPNQFEEDFPGESITITSFSLNGENLMSGDSPSSGTQPVYTQEIEELESLLLTHEQNSFAFTYSTGSFTVEEENVEFRLLGHDTHWKRGDASHLISYQNLDQGMYTLQIKLLDQYEDVIASREIKIHIRPAFWNTWWFQALSLIALFGATSLIFWYRNQQAKEREAFLTSEVSKRTHELEAAHLREHQARLQAEEANKVKTSFLSTMSHEIRTPLNAVIGTAHLLLEDSPRPEQEDSLQLLNFSAKNLLTLINDVLDYSKIEAGKLELESIPFNLKHLVRDVVRTLKVKADEAGISLEWSYSSNLPEWFEGDQTRLSQVLINLIGNAIKFTQEGSVIVQVNPDPHGFLVEVIDTGIGIPKDRQQAVFEEFSQSNSSTTRQFGGTGLGLAITGKLLRMMGTEIQLKSEPGVGSTFFFYLDLPYAGIESLPGKNQPEKEIPIEIDLTGLKLLIAEDNLVNQKVIRKFMKKWNIDHDLVINGQKALDAVKEGTYDLVLMDMNMPVMDGITATREIRNLGINVPIVGLSAATLPEEVAEMKSAGMADVVPKPFDPGVLRQKLIDSLRYASPKT